MPYFYKENTVNTLLIHIPKTGGTSVEKYLSKLYEIKLNLKSLMFKLGDPVSRQHYTYRALFKKRKEFSINFNNLKIITIVRNPYDRIISDLFYFKMIDTNTTKERICTLISSYLKKEPQSLDNHNLPQYRFLIDEHEKIPEHILVMKTESLAEDMKKNGFENFDFHELHNPLRKESLHYLNEDSIKIINSFYEKDFKLFHYDML